MLSIKKTNKCKIEVWTPIPQQKSLPGKINTTTSDIWKHVKLFWTIDTKSGGKQSKERKDDSGLVSSSMECIIILISPEFLPRGSRTIVLFSYPLCFLMVGISRHCRFLTDIKNHLQTISTIPFFFFLPLLYS